MPLVNLWSPERRSADFRVEGGTYRRVLEGSPLLLGGERVLPGGHHLAHAVGLTARPSVRQRLDGGLDGGDVGHRDGHGRGDGGGEQ